MERKHLTGDRYELIAETAFDAATLNRIVRSALESSPAMTAVHHTMSAREEIATGTWANHAVHGGYGDTSYQAEDQWVKLTAWITLTSPTKTDELGLPANRMVAADLKVVYREYDGEIDVEAYVRDTPGVCKEACGVIGNYSDIKLLYCDPTMFDRETVDTNPASFFAED